MIIDEQVLRKFYRKEVQEIALKFAQERHKRLASCCKLAIGLLIPELAVFWFLISNRGDINETATKWGLGLLAGGVILPIVLYCRNENRARQELKTAVTGKMVKAIDPKLRYSADGAVGKAKFYDSKIFISNPNLYEGEDLVYGAFDGIKIEFSEINARVEHRNGKGSTTQSTVFKGVFMLIDCNKEFKHSTVVVPDLAEGFLGQVVGNFFQNMNPMRSGNLMRMENVDFEKKFAVYADDPVETCYLLTPNLMNVMSDLQLRYPKIAFSFRHNVLYVAIPGKQNLFEYPSELSFEAFTKVYFQITEFLSFISKLGMDVRIWSKK